MVRIRRIVGSQAVTEDTDAYAVAAESAAALAKATGVARHNVAVVLGSGWGRAADAIGDGTTVPFDDLPGFPAPSAGGHVGAVRSVELAAHRVLVFLGRLHLYEGHDAAVVAHPVRVAAAAGCRTVVLTNAAGYMRPEWSVGQAVLISDHINLTALSPLTGPKPPSGERHVDLTDVYSPRLRDLARTIDPELPEGVYLGLPGPHFETPAEIRMATTIGADLVGMSTVLEAIAARHAAMEVLGISLATNLAAGISPVPLDAAEVISAGEAAAPRIGALLRAILERLSMP
jgi:purine-nucleoside phosphorylase